MIYLNGMKPLQLWMNKIEQHIEQKQKVKARLAALVLPIFEALGCCYQIIATPCRLAGFCYKWTILAPFGRHKNSQLPTATSLSKGILQICVLAINILISPFYGIISPEGNQRYHFRFSLIKIKPSHLSLSKKKSFQKDSTHVSLPAESKTVISSAPMIPLRFEPISLLVETKFQENPSVSFKIENKAIKVRQGKDRAHFFKKIFNASPSSENQPPNIKQTIKAKSLESCKDDLEHLSLEQIENLDANLKLLQEANAISKKTKETALFQKISSFQYSITRAKPIVEIKTWIKSPKAPLEIMGVELINKIIRSIQTRQALGDSSNRLFRTSSPVNHYVHSFLTQGAGGIKECNAFQCYGILKKILEYLPAELDQSFSPLRQIKCHPPLEDKEKIEKKGITKEDIENDKKIRKEEIAQFLKELKSLPLGSRQLAIALIVLLKEGLEKVWLVLDKNNIKDVKNKNQEAIAAEIAFNMLEGMGAVTRLLCPQYLRQNGVQGHLVSNTSILKNILANYPAYHSQLQSLLKK